MRTRISVLATAIVFAASASLCFASNHQANIEKYLTGEFAVKGNIEQQVNEFVVAPLSAEMSKASASQQNQIEFTVVGSADHTGGGAKNDSLAKSRADEVAAFLSKEFPGAKFITLSKGDEQNSRTVTVSWKLIPLAKKSEAQANASSPSLILYAGGGLMLLVGAGLVVLRVRNSNQETLRHLDQNANVLTMPKPEPKLNAMETVEVNGMSISCPWENGMLVTPIPNKSGDGFLRKPDARSVRSSFRNFQNNPANQQIIEELIKQGKIQNQEKEMSA